MARQKDKKKKSGNFLLKYRKIIFLVLFFIVLPIVIVASLYGSVKSGGNKVTIDEQEGLVLKSGKFEDIEDFDIFDLTVDYYRRTDMKDPDDKENIIGHNYYFKVSYKQKSVPISNVKITPVLKTPNHSYQVISSEKQLTENSSQTITFQYEQLFPVKPLAGINVKNPILYMQIVYHDESSGSDITVYLKYDISLAKDVEVN